MAANGEEVVIVRDGGSTFTVVPTPSAPHKKRGFVGSLQGKIWMVDDFDEIPEGLEDDLPEGFVAPVRHASVSRSR